MFFAYKDMEIHDIFRAEAKAKASTRNRTETLYCLSLNCLRSVKSGSRAKRAMGNGGEER